MELEEPTETANDDPARPSRWKRSRPVVLLLLAGLGVWGAVKVHAFFYPPNRTVAFSVPEAPHLSARDGETVYRIDPSRSSAKYAIEERIVGRDASTAEGTTQAIAGDIAVDLQHGDAVRLGTVVVNLEQLTSDEPLRDARIRNDYLESHKHPLATLKNSTITGLPATITPGDDYKVEIRGDLEIRDISRPTAWKAEVRLRDGRIHATASTKVNLSDFGVEPITIVGLVSTSDEATLTFDLVAIDPSKESIAATRPAARAISKQSASGVSFAKQIQPILESSCASCHASGQIGADHWELETAGDAADIASGIALVTKNRYMPPWPASSKSTHFRNDRSLSDTELAAIAKWAEAGGPLDVARSEPVKAGKVDEPTIRADIELRMEERYKPNPAVENDYRCFMVDPKLTAPTIVTGIQFHPDQLDLVHHSLVYRVSGKALKSALANDAADPTPGWVCPNDSAPLPIGQSAERQERALIKTWVPGSRPETFGEHQGFDFEVGDQILMQIHYHVHDREEVGAGDQSSLVLQTEAPSASTQALATAVAAAPVDLPCPSTATGPLCDKGAQLDALTKEYGPGGALVQAGLELACGNQTTSDPTTGSGSSRCDSAIPRSGHIVNVMGHMHVRGKTFRLTLNPDTPQEQVLLDIPTWSFGWQLTYEPVTPVPITAGDTLRIECSWDRSLVYDPDPRYILFSEGTEDEMCFSTYTIDPS